VAFYTNYTGVPQPLTELSLLVVPGKHGSSCGWGLLLFSDQRFLVHDVRPYPTLARRPPARHPIPIHPPQPSRGSVSRRDRDVWERAHMCGGAHRLRLSESDVKAPRCTALRARVLAEGAAASALRDSKLRPG